MDIHNMSIFIDKLTFLVNEISQKFIPKEYFFLTQNSFSKTQMLILEKLYKTRQCFISELAGYLCISVPAATGIVKRMSKNNLIKKQRNNKDKRVINIKLTERGKILFKAIYQRKKKELIKALGKFKKKDREDVIKHLTRLGKAVNLNNNQ